MQKYFEKKKQKRKKKRDHTRRVEKWYFVLLFYSAGDVFPFLEIHMLNDIN